MVLLMKKLKYRKKVKSFNNIITTKGYLIFCISTDKMKLYFLVVCVFFQYSKVACTQNKQKVLLYNMETVKFVCTVDERFLSFSLDSKQLAKHWKTIKLKSKRLISLTKALTPAYLRVGGTDADELVFHSKIEKDCDQTLSNTTAINDVQGNIFCRHDIISGQDIKLLGKFVNATGTELVYGLNALQRNGSKWNPANSLKLIRFMDKQGIPVSGFELGNEPRRFKKVFNKTITGHQLGKDFITLEKLLKKLPRYANSFRIGPDVTHIGTSSRKSHSVRFLQNFLKSLKRDTLSQVTFHDYYFSGKNSTIDDFLNPDMMDQFKIRINSVKKVVSQYKSQLPIWLGETSSAWGGGTPNISNRFASSFMWLDKLGQSALSGLQVVVRQCLSSPSTGTSNYGLIDSNNQPTPGFFVSYIFKKLVGNKILSNKLLPSYERESIDFPYGKLWTKDVSNKLRLYTHCTSSASSNSEGGAIVIFGVNVDNTSYKIKVISGEINLQIEEYLLTSNLTSKFSNLNHKRLKLGPHGELPPLIPRIRRESFILVPKSLGFWVIRGYNVSECH